jgi:hypothetical protein
MMIVAQKLAGKLHRGVTLLAASAVAVAPMNC